MKKSAILALIVVGIMPLSACNNGADQSGYMQNSTAESNAREAELAEQEYADLAAQESAGEEAETTPIGKHMAVRKEKHDAKHDVKHEAKNEAKHEVKPVAKPVAKQEAKPVAHHEAKHETTRKPASKEIAKPVAHAVHQTGSTHSTWTVQLGAFKVKENAEKLTAKLKKGGFPVVMRSMNHSKNGELFLVHLEPTPNKTEAEGWQSDLKTKAFDSTLTAHRE